MKTLLLIFFAIYSISTMAGLPPTSTKLSGESSFGTTFQTDFGSLTGTRAGIKITPNQTGTGAMVLQTSPTLTTPTIGAASGTSIVLGGTLGSSALLDVQSTTKGFLPPRMTSTQKDNVSSPAEGLTVYDTTNHAQYVYNGSGWVNNSVATGTPVVPGVSAGVNIEDFSLNFGATVNTSCSAASSNCAYLDQIGTAVSSVGHGTTSSGSYTLNFARTYTKLKCVANLYNGSTPAIMSATSCASCSSLTFSAIRTSDGSPIDVFGGISCRGSY